jgi:8-oxo-dGTP diphosphatase
MIDPSTLDTIVVDDGKVHIIGALITDGDGRIYAYQRNFSQDVFPGCWDVPTIRTTAGETSYHALSRVIEEETGWSLDQVLACTRDFDWDHEGERVHETDYLVSVSGEYVSPRLDPTKRRAFSWFNALNAKTLLENREKQDSSTYDLVTEALGLVVG